MANTLELGNGKWATGKDTVLAFNDENNNFKPLPFSFSRASSGTVVNKDGLIETVGSGEPRIDFKDNTKGALLLEPQRGNLVTYSEDTTEWDKNETPINTSNTTISPSGSLNADSVIVNVSSSDSNDHSVILDWNRSLVGWWTFDKMLANGTILDESTYSNDALANNHSNISIPINHRQTLP